MRLNDDVILAIKFQVNGTKKDNVKKFRKWIRFTPNEDQNDPQPFLYMSSVSFHQ